MSDKPWTKNVKNFSGTFGKIMSMADKVDTIKDISSKDRYKGGFHQTCSDECKNENIVQQEQEEAFKFSKRIHFDNEFLALVKENENALRSEGWCTISENILKFTTNFSSIFPDMGVLVIESKFENSLDTIEDRLRHMWHRYKKKKKAEKAKAEQEQQEQQQRQNNNSNFGFNGFNGFNIFTNNNNNNKESMIPEFNTSMTNSNSNLNNNNNNRNRNFTSSNFGSNSFTNNNNNGGNLSRSPKFNLMKQHSYLNSNNNNNNENRNSSFGTTNFEFSGFDSLPEINKLIKHSNLNSNSNNNNNNSNNNNNNNGSFDFDKLGSNGFKERSIEDIRTFHEFNKSMKTLMNDSKNENGIASVASNTNDANNNNNNNNNKETNVASISMLQHEFDTLTKNTNNNNSDSFMTFFERNSGKMMIIYEKNFSNDLKIQSFKNQLNSLRRKGNNYHINNTIKNALNSKNKENIQKNSN